MLGMKHKTKAELLANVTKEVITSKLIARSTLRLEYKDGSKAIRYHNTDVVTWNTNGTLTLNSGGHRTMTTKRRMYEHGRLYVYQRSYQWFVTINGTKEIPFYDGITFSGTGDLVSVP